MWSKRFSVPTVPILQVIIAEICNAIFQFKLESKNGIKMESCQCIYSLYFWRKPLTGLTGLQHIFFPDDHSLTTKNIRASRVTKTERSSVIPFKKSGSFLTWSQPALTQHTDPTYHFIVIMYHFVGAQTFNLCSSPTNTTLTWTHPSMGVYYIPTPGKTDPMLVTCPFYIYCMSYQANSTPFRINNWWHGSHQCAHLQSLESTLLVVQI
jgi:hypothetical protein